MGPRGSQDLRSPSPIMAPGDTYHHGTKPQVKREESKKRLRYCAMAARQQQLKIQDMKKIAYFSVHSIRWLLQKPGGLIPRGLLTVN